MPASLYWLFVVSGEPDMLRRTMLLLPAGALIGACIFAYAGYVVADVRNAKTQPIAQTGGPTMPDKPNPNHVTGMKIEGNGQGGAASEIVNSGGGTGAKIDVTAAEGQSATGLHAQQTGPGMASRIVQTGTGTGLSVTVRGGKPNP